MPMSGLAPQIREKIEDLDLHAISEPFPYSQNGIDRYMVVRLVEKIARKPLRIVREDIQNQLSLQLVTELQDKYQAQYYYEKLNYRAGE
jgi:hypothetical protein